MSNAARNFDFLETNLSLHNYFDGPNNIILRSEFS